MSDIGDLATLQKRLRYRAWHRGTKELDLILGPYVDSISASLDLDGIARLEALMNEPETELLSWITGQQTPPETVDIPLITEISSFARARALAKNS